MTTLIKAGHIDCTLAPLSVVVSRINQEALTVRSYELVSSDDGSLPQFAPGAHIGVDLPNGLRRSYSLVNTPGDNRRYIIAVHDDVDGRGGSRYIHDNLKVGDTLTISPPSNNFLLEEDAPHCVMIAGGIGITPLWCMIQRLEQLGRSWELWYVARTPSHMAFLKELSALPSHRVHLMFDRVAGGDVLDLRQLIAATNPGVHLYCCGPAAMLSQFESLCAEMNRHNVHVEYFHSDRDADTKGGFTVVLAKSGERIRVQQGQTILDALLDRGIEVPYSCQEGLCRSCITSVTSGVPDHRDRVLTPEERMSNRVITVCCSGSLSDEITLDL
jgi:tetrachlorobenzoquinone reductase